MEPDIGSTMVLPIGEYDASDDVEIFSNELTIPDCLPD